MYLQEILEIAIGLVFVWFVISMFAMTIQEWIASMLNLRAKNLESTLMRMLDDPNFESGFSVWWRKLWSKTARNAELAASNCKRPLSALAGTTNPSSTPPAGIVLP